MHLKLGTRHSHLALIQSQMIADYLQQQIPELTVELVKITTQGDQITSVPLQKLEGKDFFVKELDTALIERKVDLTVHSFKDLSLERPKEILPTLTFKRENPRDALILNLNRLMSHSHSSFEPWTATLHQMSLQGTPLILGSSAPRREALVGAFIQKLFPKLQIQFQFIRGNVLTRLDRLQTDCYGVILALAGLNRLYHSPPTKSLVQSKLQDTLTIVLPLSKVPGAPAQGALAIETCDPKLWKLLHEQFHQAEVLSATLKERKILESWGGGCHQALGVTHLQGRWNLKSKSAPNKDLFFQTPYLQWSLGLKKTQELPSNPSSQTGGMFNPELKSSHSSSKLWHNTLEEDFQEAPFHPPINAPHTSISHLSHLQCGLQGTLPDTLSNSNLSKQILLEQIQSSKHIFFTHPQIALSIQDLLNQCDLKERTALQQALNQCKIWVPGVSTWAKIHQWSQEGTLGFYHFQGCFEHLGYSAYHSDFGLGNFFDQPHPESTLVLTFMGAAKRWKALGFQVLECAHPKKLTAFRIGNQRVIYWKSPAEIEISLKADPELFYRKNIQHCSGYGKTLECLLEHLPLDLDPTHQPQLFLTPQSFLKALNVHFKNSASGNKKS